MHGHRRFGGRDLLAGFGSRKLRHRGLRGVKLAVSGAREGIKAAAAKAMNAAWQRCRVRFMKMRRPMKAKSSRRAVPAFIAAAFARGMTPGQLERLPFTWNCVIEKESLKFKELEHVLIEKAEQHFRDTLAAPASCLERRRRR